MFRNYLKSAYRNLYKHPGYSLIHLSGLTIGITAAFLIWQYVAFERSYDDFHTKADRIYRLPIRFYRDGAVEISDAMNYAPTGPALLDEVPEVENFVRITPEYGRVVMAYEDRLYEVEKVYYADSTFFEFFDFVWLEGDKGSCLSDPGSIVLTRSVAERYFGPRERWADSPVGRTVRVNDAIRLTVTGIMEDSPENSHIKFGALASFTTFQAYNGDPADNWGWNDFYTYVLLRPGSDREAFAAKLPDFLRRHKTFPVEGTYDEFLVQPMRDIHLHSRLGYEAEQNGDADTVAFLSLIAFAVLLIAWVNYVNLATARAEERAQEVGVRKVLGAGKSSLTLQFLTEAFLLNALAVLAAMILIQVLGPLMNGFIGKAVPLSPARLPLGFWTFPLAVVGGTLLSGLYPAFVLAATSPDRQLKSSDAARKRGAWVRRGLVIFQYATAVILIAVTLVIYRQLQFMQGQDLGFSLERTLVLNAPSVIRDDSLYQLRYRSFREALAIYPDIVNVASSSAIPGKNMYDLDTHGGLRLVGASEAEAATFSSMRVEPGFLETYGMRLVAGRAFSRDRKADQGGLILNETAAQVLGFPDPGGIIGKRIQYWQEQKEIIGVIEDYHHKSLRHVVEPLILRNDPNGHLYFSIKFSDAGQAAVERLVEQVRRSWKGVYPDNPFHFFFLDDHFQEQYLADVQLGRIAALFSLLTIFIACLGLFGLASYTVSVRTKEIGIRKVLGASATSIVLLLSRRYLHWLLLAFLIGVPAAYYLCRHWLQNFTSTISLSPWLFVLPCLLVLVIGLATVSGQSLQAATRNPVDALRKE